MDVNVAAEVSKIRQIEDIIDIQKANGIINVRQVAFNLPSKTDSTISASLTKSLDSGLPKVQAYKLNKKSKKAKYKRNTSLSPDAVSWPSDSDITVLRMKLYLTRALKTETGNIILGDGLHQPDSSSMVNLATLMVHSRPPSKDSLNIEEYLLPISTWEQSIKSGLKETEGEQRNTCSISRNLKTYEVMSQASYLDSPKEKVYLSNNSLTLQNNLKSKLARFLRLYFCPCCTCLYELENMQTTPSSFFTKKVTFLENQSS